MAMGFGKAPAEPLPILIAMYALVAGRADTPLMWWLLNELHPSESVELREPMGRGEAKTKRPDPSKVDMAKLKEKIRTLQLAAVQVAQIVRGKDIRRGTPTRGLSPRHHAALELIGERQGR